ncbi:hypothetical protein scyTo_0006747 [Scyliorhinus torazame]|uniref:Uncharacterized protein n=1 Tax=Scyliorhinus torazame TaxID=75743 RepID=A0A401PJW1_SCYTO|nr:hypothetical protein [Scyliorhinus torazame]
MEQDQDSVKDTLRKPSEANSKAKQKGLVRIVQFLQNYKGISPQMVIFSMTNLFNQYLANGTLLSIQKIPQNGSSIFKGCSTAHGDYIYYLYNTQIQFIYFIYQRLFFANFYKMPETIHDQLQPKNNRIIVFCMVGIDKHVLTGKSELNF